MAEYLVLAATVFALNLLPAFGPPTWTVLVFFTIARDVPPVIAVPLGAAAAASGRFVLASGARMLRDRLPVKRTRELDVLRDAAERNRGASLATLGLFALSPLPSAQLFVAAGLTGVRLVPLTLAFFGGRLVSYTIYVTIATSAEASIEQIVREGWNTPWAMALQLTTLVALVALVFVPWSRVVARWTPSAKP